MSIPLIHVDAFTDKPFAGNPAAVCLLDRQHDKHWMQNVAREMNLSETAFLLKRDDGYGLRWFTPEAEVKLCGHATLASAHVLWVQKLLGQDEEARFHTRSGLLSALRKGRWIEMDSPSEPEKPAIAPSRYCMLLVLRLCAPAGTGSMYQASSRGGVVDVRTQGDRVILSGQAVTVMRGELAEDQGTPYAACCSLRRI